MIYISIITMVSNAERLITRNNPLVLSGIQNGGARVKTSLNVLLKDEDKAHLDLVVEPT